VATRVREPVMTERRTSIEIPERINIAQFLPEFAALEPERDAVRIASGKGTGFSLRGITYAELETRSNRIARGLVERGLEPGDRVCLFVRPGIDLIAITFALLKVGAVPVLIDPGMGRRSLLACVERMKPKAFIGIALAHALKRVFPAAFQTVELSVTVGRRWIFGGVPLDELLSSDDSPFLHDTARDDEAAILFTSGSTGPPKGVTYTHGIFYAQILALRELYSFEPGEIDAACFPLFALFSPALRLTCVFPELDPSQPARCDPERIVEAILRTGATTTFGSPAIWRRVVPWCLERGVTLPSLKRVLIAGAPIPPFLVEGFEKILAEGADVHTPYGATESLPVSSISGREILGPARALTESGAGTCVGRPAPGIDLRLIEITDAAIPHWKDAREVPQGEPGEICVRGPVVTHEYKFQEEPTALSKIVGEEGDLYHRMGDIGHLDEEGFLWFGGRKAHRLETERGLLMPVGIENIFNPHPRVHRTALVGIGERGRERPVLVIEAAEGERPRSSRAREEFRSDLRSFASRHEAAGVVTEILFHPAFPVDVRHNAKIHREELKRWAEAKLS
jgi:olefin beta-lactone synthetase